MQSLSARLSRSTATNAASVDAEPEDVPSWIDVNPGEQFDGASLGVDYDESFAVGQFHKTVPLSEPSGAVARAVEREHDGTRFGWRGVSWHVHERRACLPGDVHAER